MKKIAHKLFGRLTVVGFFILLQVAWMVAVLYEFCYKFTYANLLIRAIAIIVLIALMNRWTNPSHKLSWTFLILLSPILGVSLYIVFGRSNLTKGTRKRMDSAAKNVRKYLKQSPEIMRELEINDKAIYRQVKYINDWANFPIYENTKVSYYKCGEEMFPDMLEALKSARKFIFLEYFIVDDGYMFDQMVNILEEKVKEGVDVRLIYDDVGCITTLPNNYYKTLQAKGIKCAAFNPFRPVLSVIMNNRDHRKIFVVDGNVGFTGGLNIADEYINRIERFGYWKDTGVRLEGEAVWSLTTMFLQMWSYITRATEDYTAFMPAINHNLTSDKAENTDKSGVMSEDDFGGYVLPYGDTPLDRENVAENIYMNIINNATDYVYIFTPYLIVDQEMLITLCNAAKRGVDVRIVTPGIPDKKLIFFLTQSYYEPLIESGVKIYQYRPGFIHAKNFICDDKVATVGSVNLDYRSLYLHFECGVYMYKVKAIMKIKEDCREVFAASDEITMEFCKNRNIVARLVQGVMQLFAPLL